MFETDQFKDNTIAEEQINGNAMNIYYGNNGAITINLKPKI